MFRPSWYEYSKSSTHFMLDSVEDRLPGTIFAPDKLIKCMYISNVAIASVLSLQLEI